MGLLESIRSRLHPRRGVLLALSGGGARGIAHIGVLQVLEDEGIPIAGIAGTSAGAMVGSMWIALGSASAVEQRWRELITSGVLPGSLPGVRLANALDQGNVLLQLARRLQRGATVAIAMERRCLLPPDGVAKVIDFLIPDIAIRDLRLPFAAVATDFADGQPVAIRSGSLREAIAASSAVPGAMMPVLIDGRVLIDGGVVADVPTQQAAELGHGPVVAIDAGETLNGDNPPEVTVPSALIRANLMTHTALRDRLVDGAALVLRPRVGGIHWSEFGLIDQALAAGREAATAALPALCALVGRQRRSTVATIPPQPALAGQ